MAKPKDKKAAAKIKKVGSKRWELFEVSGDSVKRKRRSCPKCGTGTFMAQHKDRVVCGSCSYMESTKKEAPKEEDTEKKEE
jgi:ubiquitin-small subunit ribosomal protein S27Ae